LNHCKKHTFFQMIRKLYYLLPPSLRLVARRLYYFPLDMWESLTGKRNPLVPPRGLIFTGPGDFLSTGERFLRYFVRYGNLQPHHRVLDIGSGIGRMAVPLTGYLTRGSYEGFDIVPQGIRWCQQNISRRFPNFRFTHIHLQNDLYTSQGQSSLSFIFPYEKDDFDFVLLTSVFTHMLPEEVIHYMKEIHRVLKEGGRCLATFFILNEESTQLLKNNRHFCFPYDHGYYRLMDNKVKHANVAYEENFMRKNLAEDNGFSVVHVLYGRWCGRPEEKSVDFQDIVVFEKKKG